MKKTGTSFELSATDLVGYLNCRHLSDLDPLCGRRVTRQTKRYGARFSRFCGNVVPFMNRIMSPIWSNPGLEVVHIDGVDVTEEAVKETLAAMKTRRCRDCARCAFIFWLGWSWLTYFVVSKNRASSAIGHMR